MTAKLKAYEQKRNFEKTGEPKAAAVKTGEYLRFVVQHHIAHRDHYDFRLEWDGALLSWAVPKGPSYNIADKRLAVRVEDHPLEYRNFEGTIPKGEYGGGTVMLWDEGYWTPQTDIEKGLRGGSLKFMLQGKRLKGNWTLVRMAPKNGETADNWLLIKEKDDFAQSGSGIGAYDTSVRTGRTMEEIEAQANEKKTKNPFSETGVQLAKLQDKVPEGDDWLYELKYDGYRIVAFIEAGIVRLMTRNVNNATDRFCSIAVSLAKWAGQRAMVLDGEIAVADKSGRTDFQALQNYMRRSGGEGLTYIVFDLLALDGEDLRSRPLADRKNKLESLIKNAPPEIHYSKHVRGNGEKSFQAACKSHLEGIVCKRAESPYSATRNGDWVKLKCDRRQEFVIGGYTLSEKRTRGVSSILLGVYEDEKLVYAGRAGTGLSADTMQELEKKFAKIKRSSSPFSRAPAISKKEKITWLKPTMVAEIKFAEWTDENVLRQASFKGIRTDKNPREVIRERAEK